MKKATEPKKGKVNIKVIIIILLILLLIISIFVLRSTLTIRSIEVIIENQKVAEETETQENPENTNQVEPKITKENILELAQINVGDKLYRFLRSEISDRIEQNSYVQEAKIQRNINGKVKITITQREPKYLMNYAGEYLYIDREGYVLEVNGVNNGDPIITGLITDCSSLSIGNTKIRLNKEDLEKLEIINNILASFESNGVLNRIYTINAEDKNNIILNLNDDQKTIYIGNGTDLNTKVLYAKKMLENEAGHSGIIFVNGDLNEGHAYFREQ